MANEPVPPPPPGGPSEPPAPNAPGAAAADQPLPGPPPPASSSNSWEQTGPPAPPEPSDPAGTLEDSAPEEMDSWRPPPPPGGTPDPSAASGPPWPRLVATGRSYTPPRLIRWPIVIGAILLAAWIAAVAIRVNSSSNQPSAAAPYVLTAGDAQFTATFPGQPQRSEKTASGITVIFYQSTLSDHAVAVGYVPVPTGGFSLDGGITGAAAGEKGGKVVSRTTLTYQGQPAEEGVISYTDGVAKVRVVVFGPSAYILEGFGTTASSFAADYNTLIDTFTTTSEPARTTTSPPVTTAPTPPATSPAAGTLGSKVVPAPAGFTVSQTAGVANGPVNAAGFDSFIGTKGVAAQLHYVTGYQITYDSIQGSDSVAVALFQFTAPADATIFVTGFSQSSGIKTGSDPAIPGAVVYDSTAADSSGSYQHGVIAAKGDTVMIVNYSNGSATRPALVNDLAQQQYSKLA